MKNLYAALFLVACTALGCTQQSDPVSTAQKQDLQAATPQDNQAEEETLRVMHAMFDAFNRHDLNAMQALYADSAVFLSPDMPEPVMGDEQVHKIYGSLFEMAPDVQNEIEHYIVNGNEVAVEFVSTGTVTNLSPDDPIEMKGKEFNLRIFARLKVENGKITEDISYFDQMAFLHQLGLTE